MTPRFCTQCGRVTNDVLLISADASRCWPCFEDHYFFDVVAPSLALHEPTSIHKPEIVEAVWAHLRKRTDEEITAGQEIPNLTLAFRGSITHAEKFRVSRECPACKGEAWAEHIDGCLRLQ